MLTRIEKDLAQRSDAKLFEYIKTKFTGAVKTSENIQTLLAHEHFDGAKELSVSATASLAAFLEFLQEMEDFAPGGQDKEEEVSSDLLSDAKTETTPIKETGNIEPTVAPKAAGEPAVDSKVLV